MITKDKEVKSENLVLIDEFRRPTILPENPITVEYWKNFHNIVKTSDVDIFVNSIFYYIDDLLSNPEGAYIGGGFKYYFWVRSQEDKDKFIKMINSLSEKKEDGQCGLNEN